MWFSISAGTCGSCSVHGVASPRREGSCGDRVSLWLVSVYLRHSVRSMGELSVRVPPGKVPGTWSVRNLNSIGAAEGETEAHRWGRLPSRVRAQQDERPGVESGPLGISPLCSGHPGPWPLQGGPRQVSWAGRLSRDVPSVSSEDAAVKGRLVECLETVLNKAQEPPKSKKVQHSNAKNAILFETISLIIHYDRCPPGWGRGRAWSPGPGGAGLGIVTLR